MAKYKKYCVSNFVPQQEASIVCPAKSLKTVPSSRFRVWGMGKCCLGDSKGKHWGTGESSCDCRAKPWPRETLFTISLDFWVLSILGAAL